VTAICSPLFVFLGFLKSLIQNSCLQKGLGTTLGGPPRSISLELLLNSS
jgi:hypothetical protein